MIVVFFFNESWCVAGGKDGDGNLK